VIFTGLELENFRQFYGRQQIDLGISPDRNVILVYGANGAGKTTLLNAFTWALYCAFSPAFDDPDHLINERAWAEAAVGDDVTASVSLEFDDEDRRYTVVRRTVERKEADGSALRVQSGAPTVSFIDEYGKYNSRDDTSEGTIDAILPERLHRFFFFDGERIDDLVKPDAYKEIEQAIKGILGLEVVERAIKHTNEARKALERDLRQLGDDKDRELADQLDDIRAKIEERRQALDQHRGNLAALEDERQTVGEELAKLAEAAELQQRREELEQELDESEKAMRSSRDSLASQVGRKGWLAFIGGLAPYTIASFDDRRERGEIPADLKRQFVEDLLERGTCICGCELTPDGEPYSRVAAYKQRTLDPDVEVAWMRLPASASTMLASRGEFYDYIHRTQEELARLRDAKQRIVDKLSAISDDLRHGANNEVKALEERREELSEQTREEDKLIARAETDIEGLETREGDLERQLKKARDENALAELARRRVSVAGRCAAIFSAILSLRTAEVRQQLDARLKELYRTISFKPYVPVLDAAFRLELRNLEVDRTAAKSTGENQILSLCFVGALAEHARERHETANRDAGDKGLSFQGGIYPIVMDSPFGSLDTNYQELTAQAIPALASQIIVFVSRSQGTAAIQRELALRIQRQYVIECHTTKPELEPETIALSSGVYPFITPSTDAYERAELIPVRP
jgi:DNA sulfur modification protein DndD